MAANREMQSFFELRTVLEKIQHDTNAALAFMDRTGLALQTSKRGRPGNGAGRVNVERLREKATELFQARRGRNGADTNGSSEHTTVSIKEAAKILKVSDATIRNYINAGTLPKATRESRQRKNGTTVKLMVLQKEDVISFRDASKEAERAAKEAERAAAAG